MVLGGSRARGDSLPGPDVDLGVYYLGTPDAAALSELATRWAGQRVEVGPEGSWGHWVDAGGWLCVDETPVDWILRDLDLDRVRGQWARAQRGEYEFHPRAGHPLGFLDVSYAGELATGVVLADPTGALAALRHETLAYTPELRDAMVDGLWEARFLVEASRKGVDRLDGGYVVLCLPRALLLCAHALQANAGVWVTNEKGLIPSVAELARSHRRPSRPAPRRHWGRPDPPPDH